MAIHWETEKDRRRKKMAIADKTYYLNADKSKAMVAGKTDEPPEGAAFLLVREGGQVSDEDVEKYGVKTREPEAAAEEPNIVISGGRDTGPAVVKGEPIAGQQEGQARTAAASGKTNTDPVKANKARK